MSNVRIIEDMRRLLDEVFVSARSMTESERALDQCFEALEGVSQSSMSRFRELFPAYFEAYFLEDDDERERALAAVRQEFNTLLNVLRGGPDAEEPPDQQ